VEEHQTQQQKIQQLQKFIDENDRTLNEFVSRLKSAQSEIQNALSLGHQRLTAMEDAEKSEFLESSVTICFVQSTILFSFSLFLFRPINASGCYLLWTKGEPQVLESLQ